MEEKICEKGMFWGGNGKEKVWWMVTVVTTKVSWYDCEGVMNQEEKCEDIVDEMSHEVDSRDELMSIEMSDLWFSRLSEIGVERGWQVMMSECSEGTGEISTYIGKKAERY